MFSTHTACGGVMKGKKGMKGKSSEVIGAIAVCPRAGLLTCLGV